MRKTKIFSALALLASLVTASLAGFATPPDTTKSSALTALPAGVELQELHRYFWRQNGTSGYHFSGWFLPRDWETRYRLEGSLGFVSKTSFANSRPIYNCLVEVPGKNPSPFTSLDVNCEGQIPNRQHGFTGYISNMQIEGTAPLYRCNLFTPGHPHHFDTLSANCDGNAQAQSEGVLGYVFL